MLGSYDSCNCVQNSKHFFSQLESESPPSPLNTFNQLSGKENRTKKNISEKLEKKNQNQNKKISPIEDPNDEIYNQKYSRTPNLLVKCLMSILYFSKFNYIKWYESFFKSNGIIFINEYFVVIVVKLERFLFPHYTRLGNYVRNKVSSFLTIYNPSITQYDN